MAITADGCESLTGEMALLFLWAYVRKEGWDGLCDAAAFDEQATRIYVKEVKLEKFLQNCGSVCDS